MKEILSVVRGSLASLVSLATWLAGAPLGAAPLPPVNWTHLSSANGDLPVPPVNTGQTGLRVIDLDKDGQTDYIVTLLSAPAVVWYRHVGNTFEKYVIDPQALDLSHGEEFKDIDGDGDIDLIFGQGFQGNQIFWWENPYPNYSTNTPWVRRLVRINEGNFLHDNIWGDFDGDGKDEFICWNQYAQQLLLFELPTDPKNSGPWPATRIFSWPTLGELYDYRGVDVIDINLDGKVDLVGGGGWFEHTGGTSFTYHLIDDSMRSARHVAGQLITGGRPEIVTVIEKPAYFRYTTTSPLNMYEWTGSSWVQHSLLTNLFWSHTLQLGDINQDGFLDIVTGEMGQLGTELNPDASLVALYGDGTGNFAKHPIFIGQGTLEGQLADIDNDGDLDMVGSPYRDNIPRMDIWINEGLSPIITPKGGSFDDQVEVSLSSVAGDAIHYTIDGSAATDSSPLYTGPFELRATATLRAVSTQNGTVLATPSSATFVVASDVVAPSVVSVQAVQNSTTVTVLFSEPVDPTTAQTVANYSIDSGIMVSAAALDVNLKTVHLTTSPLAEGVVYTLTVNHVSDRATPANSIAANTRATFSFRSLASQGLALWLRADLGTMLNGSRVQEWKDQSGHNRHATQSSAIYQPALLDHVLTGLPTVHFDGLDDFFTFNLPVNGLAGLSLFLVSKSASAPGSHPAQRAALFWNETAGWGTVYLSPFQSQVNMRFGTTQANNTISYSRPASVGGDFTLSAAIKDGTTDSLYVNRTLVLSQGNKLATISGCRDLANLARGYNDNSFFSGDVAEVLIYSRALTSSERQAVVDYLDNKYALATPVAPRITIQPSDLAVHEPQLAPFIVRAAGTAPLAFQWRCDGVAIAGATSTNYVLNPTSQASHNGHVFDAIVSNASGSVTSRVATLTVSTPDVLNLTCAPDKMVICGSAWNFDTPTATGNCGSVTLAVLSTVTNMADACSFTATRTWQATDVCHDSATCSQTVTVTPAPPPELAIELSGLFVRFSWPANESDYMLEMSQNLSSGSWSEISMTPVVQGERKVVSYPVAGAGLFFRLHLRQ